MGEPGQVIGRYRLEAKIGQGGMGSVWRGLHVELNTPAAVKLIESEKGASEDALARFKREAKAAATLRSVNVVQIFDFGVDGDTPYIAMELLDGESLQDKIEREGAIAPLATAQILRAVAKAMARAHKAEIIHRDLKPDNIFLAREGDEVVVKVLDFGIAKFANPFANPTDHRTKTGAVLGTPFYMSPEQSSGKQVVDHRTDIWAFGIIAHECLLGRNPFHGEETLGGLLLAICTEPIPPPSTVGPVPAGFDEWFAKITSRDVNQRYDRISVAGEDLAGLCGLATMSNPDASQPVPALSLEALSGMTTPSALGTTPRPVTGDEHGATTPLLRNTAAQAPPSSITLNTEGEAHPKKSPALWIAGGVAGLLILGAVGAAAAVALGGGGDEAAAATNEPVEAAAAAPAASSEDTVSVEPVDDETEPAAEPEVTASAAPEEPEPPEEPQAQAPKAPQPRATPRPTPAPKAQPKPEPKPEPKPTPKPGFETEIGF